MVGTQYVLIVQETMQSISQSVSQSIRTRQQSHDDWRYPPPPYDYSIISATCTMTLVCACACSCEDELGGWLFSKRGKRKELTGSWDVDEKRGEGRNGLARK